MKKCVPWALSGLPALRPSMPRFGLAMMNSLVAGSWNGRSGMVRPVQPITAISTASSNSLSGSLGSVER
jgi:hypothetical protein